jgi:endoglucanase
LLPNGQFDEVAAPWMPYFGPDAAGTAGVDNGQLCLTVTASGTNEWDAQLRARAIRLAHGHTISVRLRVSATPAATLGLKLAMQGAPYTNYWQQRVEASPESKSLEAKFVMSASSDDSAELAVMVGGGSARSLPTKVCIDDVLVRDPDADSQDPDAEPEPSVVRVNQLGFRPSASKLGVLVSDIDEPREFFVVTSDGNEVFRGMSETRGFDAASGDRVHWLDFSAFAAPCESCQLRVEDARSAPFRVAENVLSSLVASSLGYFYYNRSGTPIVLPYAGEQQWYPQRRPRSSVRSNDGRD